MILQKTVVTGACCLWALTLVACNDDDKNESPGGYATADVQRGAQLYDQWWAVPGAKSSAAPADTNPGYSLTTGTQTGAATWRCKECHGWDYRGSQGAYASGSHATGVAGLLGVRSDAPEELFGAIKQGKAGTAMSAFEGQLSDDDIWDLVKFVKEGLVDTSSSIDSTTKAPIGADAAKGATLFAATCASSSCHGAQGNALNFGTDAEPEFLGTIATDNPWEFIHKVRAGQPGTAMPSALKDTQWTLDDILDVLAHSRTLPTQ